MLLEFDGKRFKSLNAFSIKELVNRNEKALENFLKESIGDTIFPNLLVIGNERAFQKEADLFALDSNGNLVVLELKVDGTYDEAKIYQAMKYAQIFSIWKYEELNEHYKKCFPNNDNELKNAFEEHFGYELDTHDFNQNQKIIVISHNSNLNIKKIVSYWKSRGIDIEEYYYRFYQIGEKQYFELSNEMISFSDTSYHCWINTCRRYIPKAYIDMIKNNKASVYGDHCGMIGNWVKNAYIFLYHNEYGIIGAGIGTAKIKDDEYNDFLDDQENSIQLKDFIHGVNLQNGEIKKFIPAKKIKQLLNRNFFFSTTIVPLTSEEGEALYNECKKRF